MSTRFSARSRSGSPARYHRDPPSALKHAVYDVATDRYLWLASIVALIFAILAIVFAHDDYSRVHSWARTPTWLENPVILSALVIITLLLTSWATVHGFHHANYMWRMLLPALFLIIGILFVIFTYLTYSSHNFVAAFVVAVVCLVFTLIHWWGVAYYSVRGAAWLCFPWVLLNFVFVYLLWFMADESSDCLARTTPVYQLA